MEINHFLLTAVIALVCQSMFHPASTEPQSDDDPVASPISQPLPVKRPTDSGDNTSRADVMDVLDVLEALRLDVAELREMLTTQQATLYTLMEESGHVRQQLMSLVQIGGWQGRHSWQ